MPIVAKLDELGRPAWVLLMILGFVWWWPVGLMILAYIIGSGRMSCGYNGDRWERKLERMQGKMERLRGHLEGKREWWSYQRSSGNRAFDEYRTETLRRLEDEQSEAHEEEAVAGQAGQHQGGQQRRRTGRGGYGQVFEQRRLDPRLAQHADIKANPFVALNTAFLQQVNFVRDLEYTLVEPEALRIAPGRHGHPSGQYRHFRFLQSWNRFWRYGHGPRSGCHRGIPDPY